MMYSYSCSYRLDSFEKEHIRLVTPRLTDREKVSFSCVLINVDICGKMECFILAWASSYLLLVQLLAML